MSSQIFRNKVTSVLNIIYTRCQSGRPFLIADVAKMVCITASISTIMKRLGIIEKEGSQGQLGAKWRWLRGEVNEHLITEMMVALKEYYQTHKTKGITKGNPLFCIPSPQMSVNNAGTISTPQYLKNAETRQGSDSIAVIPPTKHLAEIIVPDEILYMFREMKEKIDFLYTKLTDNA